MARKETHSACPFCGGDQLEVCAQITCSKCWATGPDPNSPNDFEGDWDTRSIETLPDRIARAYPAHRLVIPTEGAVRGKTSWTATLSPRVDTSDLVPVLPTYAAKGTTFQQALKALTGKLNLNGIEKRVAA